MNKSFIFFSLLLLPSCGENLAPSLKSCTFQQIHQESGDQCFYELVDSVKQGRFMCLDQQKRLLYTGNYTDGKSHGILSRFHKNGQLLASENWVRGLKQGGVVRYDRQGLVSSFAYFKNDSLIYLAHYNNAGGFERFEGIPVVDLRPRELVPNDNNYLHLTIELVAPPYVETEFEISEYLSGEKLRGEKYSFSSGVNEFSFKVTSSNSDSIKLNFFHTYSIDNDYTETTESQYYFPLAR